MEEETASKQRTPVEKIRIPLDWFYLEIKMYVPTFYVVLTFSQRFSSVFGPFAEGQTQPTLDEDLYKSIIDAATSSMFGSLGSTSMGEITVLYIHPHTKHAFIRVQQR